MTILILALYALLPAFFAGLYFAGSLYSFTELFAPYNLSIISGSAAYVVFMSQFLLSSRIRLLERHIPQDRLLALHGSAGMASLVLVILHFIFKYFMILQYEGITFQSLLGLFALFISVILSPLAYKVLRGKGQKRGESLPYARVKRWHNLFALAGLAVIVHVLLASSTWSPALKIFTLVWGILTLGAYIQHKIVRPRLRKHLILHEVMELSSGINQYFFQGSVDRKSGQFGYFSFIGDVPGREEHPFTISSPSDKNVCITVRSSGDFTETLPQISLGTAVRFDGPYGHSHPRRFPEGTAIVFLAGGIGITPVLSLAQDKQIRTLYPITILWSIRDRDEAAVGACLQILADKGEINFQTHISGTDGRIDESFLKSGVLDKLVKDSPSAFFICGPGGFGTTMNGILKNQGISRRQIVEERFSW